MTTERGFSLIELLVVIVILSMVTKLVAINVGALNSFQSNMIINNLATYLKKIEQISLATHSLVWVEFENIGESLVVKQYIFDTESGNWSASSLPGTKPHTIDSLKVIAVERDIDNPAPKSLRTEEESKILNVRFGFRLPLDTNSNLQILILNRENNVISTIEHNDNTFTTIQQL